MVDRRGKKLAGTDGGPGDAGQFPGFERPDKNWSKLPHALIEALPTIETLSELKVILYVLRHTWGYQEFGVTKRITLDEFQRGRKLADGSRMDGGTGLSLSAVKDGVRRAVAHGFLVREVEVNRDKGSNPTSIASECRALTPGYRTLIPWVSKIDTLMVKPCPPGDHSLPPDQRKKQQKEAAERNKRSRRRLPSRAPSTTSE